MAVVNGLNKFAITIDDISNGIYLLSINDEQKI